MHVYCTCLKIISIKITASNRSNFTRLRWKCWHSFRNLSTPSSWGIKTILEASISSHPARWTWKCSFISSPCQGVCSGEQTNTVKRWASWWAGWQILHTDRDAKQSIHDIYLMATNFSQEANKLKSVSAYHRRKCAGEKRAHCTQMHSR